MSSRKSKNKLKTKRKKRVKFRNKFGVSYTRTSAHGIYKGIKYESCLELATILHCENLGLKIARPDIQPTIRYLSSKDAKIHRYYPDFIVEDFLVLEVKGFFAKNKLASIFEKQAALDRYCRENGLWSMMITSDMLSETWLRSSRKIHKALSAKTKKK